MDPGGYDMAPGYVHHYLWLSSGKYVSLLLFSPGNGYMAQNGGAGMPHYGRYS